MFNHAAIKPLREPKVTSRSRNMVAKVVVTDDPMAGISEAASQRALLEPEVGLPGMVQTACGCSASPSST
jgi:hypothetical protein